MNSSVDIVNWNLSQISRFEPRYSWIHVYITSVILGTLILCTIIGNVFVVAAIILERNLQSVSNYLILSLAVTDLMVASLVMSISVISEVSKKWFLGIGLCDFYVCFDVLCCSASILHLVAIAMDRYWAVTNIDYIRVRTARLIFVMIALVWFISIIISIPSRFFITRTHEDMYISVVVNGRCDINDEQFYTIFSTVGAFYLPMFILLAIYLRIYQTARARIRRKAFKKKLSQRKNNQHHHNHSNIQYKSSTQSINDATSAFSQIKTDFQQIKGWKRFLQRNNPVSRLNLTIVRHFECNSSSYSVDIADPQTTSTFSKFANSVKLKLSHDRQKSPKPPSLNPSYRCDNKIKYDPNKPGNCNQKTQLKILPSPILNEIDDDANSINQTMYDEDEEKFDASFKTNENWNWKDNSSLTDSPRLTKPLKPSENSQNYADVKQDIERTKAAQHKTPNIQRYKISTNFLQPYSLSWSKTSLKIPNISSNNTQNSSTNTNNHDSCSKISYQTSNCSFNTNSNEVNQNIVTIENNDYTNLENIPTKSLEIPDPKLEIKTYSATAANLQKQKLEHRRERKAARILAIITGCFILCWLPFFITALIIPFCGESCIPHPALSSCWLWLGYCNSLLNPIIYTIFSPEFRNAFNKILFGRYQRTKRR